MFHTVYGHKYEFKIMDNLHMGQVCNWPGLSWAEYVMGQDIPEPYHLMWG